MTKTIYEAIKADHETHRELLDAISHTRGDSQKRREKWDEFYYDVKAHAAAEEETFYSRLMAKEDGQSDARHSVAEHKEMDDLMEELNVMDMDADLWMKKFEQLKHDYEHHMEEEEEDIFSTARKVLKDDGDGEIAGRFETRKKAERKLVDEKAEASLDE